MRRLLGWTFLFAVAGIGVARGDYVTNGGFQTGNASGWAWSTDANLFDVVMFDVYGGNGASLAFRVDPTSSALGTVGTLTQWLQLDGGTSYAVSWEQGMQNIGPELTLSGTIEVRLGNQLLSRWGQGGLGANQSSGLHETKTFTPSVTSKYELNFRFVRDAGAYGDSTMFMYVDNVSVVDPTAIVVPAPSSLACLVGVGVMVVGAEWWKKRSNARR